MGRPSLGYRLILRDGIYYIAWSENRRSKRLSTGTGNLAEAQKVLGGALLENEQEKERGVRMTVGAAITYYDTNHIENEVEDKKRQRRALAYVKDVLGKDTFMDELDAKDFTEYRTKRKKMQRVFKTKNKNRQHKPVNDATIRRELNTFLAAANFCVRNRKMENRHVPIVVLPEHNAGRDRWLTRAEADVLFNAVQPAAANRLTREYRMFALAIGTYRRRRAIETLKWFRVDFDSRIIDFRRPGEPESKKRRGIAAIPDWLFPILKRAFEEKVSEYVLDRPGVMVREIRAACDGAGMPDVSAHTLRHTGGTWAAQAGVSMWEIAGAMGCTVATAERNYLHHSPDHLRRVVNRVSGVAPGENPGAQAGAQRPK